jgi:hypothetical protein
MSNWRDPSKSNWSFSSRKIIGIGSGIGQYKTAYAVQTSIILLNGKVEADIKVLDPSRTFAAGLVCRADELWSYIAFYVLHNPQQNVLCMAIGVSERGTFIPLVASQQPITLVNGYNHFSLEFFSGTIQGQVRSETQTYTMSAVVPHIALPGYVGVAKFYDTQVSIKNFCSEPLTSPFEKVNKPMYKYDVFISHSSADKPIIEKIAAEFRTRGISYWLDSEQIKLGDSIIGKIEDGLRDSKHVLVCLSPTLGKSNWCRAEYGAVLHKYFSGATNKRVIPLKLDNVADEDVPSLLYDIRRADYSKPEEFEELIDYIKN